MYLPESKVKSFILKILFHMARLMTFNDLKFILLGLSPPPPPSELKCDLKRLCRAIMRPPLIYL